MPYDMEPALLEDTQVQVKNAIAALGLNNCAVNVDLIEKGGKAYIIELTGRVGANCLPELTGNYFGINYYEMILRTALGESPLPVFEKRSVPCHTLARMIRSERSGKCKRVFVPEVEGAEVHVFIHEGSEIRSFTNSNDAIGEVIAKGNSFEDCEAIISKVLNNIKIDYE